MPSPCRQPSRPYGRMCIITAATLTLLAAAACGSGGSASGGKEFQFQKTLPSDRTYALEDFAAAGFKKSKEYNIEGLPQAESAWKGFWGPDAGSRTDYELRFYPSHDAAVEAGAPLADEATGEEFKLKKDSQTWTEGAKDRWRSGNVTAGATGGVTAGPGPIYGDFAIFGNVVILCEGADSGQALERCRGLVEALRKATGD